MPQFKFKFPKYNFFQKMKCALKSMKLFYISKYSLFECGLIIKKTQTGWYMFYNSSYFRFLLFIIFFKVKINMIYLIAVFSILHLTMHYFSIIGITKWSLTKLCIAVQRLVTLYEGITSLHCIKKTDYH